MTSNTKSLTILSEWHSNIDSKVKPLEELHKNRLECRGGCSQCCVDELSVFEALSSVISATISPVVVANSCYVAESPVVWTDLVNVGVNGNDISRQSGNSWGGSGAASESQITDNMYMYTVAGETNKYRMIGLSSSNLNAHYNTIDFAIYLRNNGTLQIYESGVLKGGFGNYSNGDTLKVSVEFGVINYYRNSDLFYTSLTSPSLPMIVDASIYSNGGTLQDVTVGGYVENTFNCITNNVGTNPTYQWKLNGSPVGTNNSVYLNNSLTDNDVIICEVIPDIINCGASSVYTNSVNIYQQLNPSIDAFIEAVNVSNSCYVAESPVVWTDLVNVGVNGNDISRQSGNSWGGSGAASESQITDNMYMYTVAGETNKYRMIGLSSSNLNAHYNTIDFAIYLRNNGTLQIYESGVLKGGFGNYSNGDTLKVSVEFGVINYYRNSDLFYTPWYRE